MSIDYQHKEYAAHVGAWQRISNVCSGDDVDQYLCEIHKEDTSPENQARNKSYKERAIFYRIAGQTSDGLLALMFSKAPELSVPAGLEYIGDDVDGAGTSIYQQAQDLARDVIENARGGLFVSYPETNGPLSQADVATGKYFATINEIDPDRIINWRYRRVGSKMMLSLVVITEEVEEIGPDGYTVETVKQIKELYLDEADRYAVQNWRYDDQKKEWYRYEDPIMPTDSAGNRWDEILFTFVGAQSNTADVDDSIMRAIVDINIGHYRNSADYEDSVYWCGQAQAWMSGVTQTHIDLMKKNNMYVGAPVVMGVPQGEQFGYASAPPNVMVRQAMLDKVDHMIGLGARYLKVGGVAKTAEEAGNDAQIQHSALSLISQNIGDAYTKCIEWMARFNGVSGEGTFRPTTDFANPNASPQELHEVVASFVMGSLPMGDYFAWMKRHGYVADDKTIEQFAEEVSANSGVPNLDQGA